MTVMVANAFDCYLRLFLPSGACSISTPMRPTLFCLHGNKTFVKERGMIQAEEAHWRAAKDYLP